VIERTDVALFGKPLSVCVADRLRAVADAGFGEEVIDVALHGCLADEETGGDLARGTQATQT
jgi:hypothetical protein